MITSAALRLIGAAAFMAIVAPLVAFALFGAVVSIQDDTFAPPSLSELPGFYVEVAPMLLFAVALFAVSLGAAATRGSFKATRIRVVLLAALAFAAVFTAPAVQGLVSGGRVSAVHLLIAALGIAAGCASGALLPLRLVPRATNHNDA